MKKILYVGFGISPVMSGGAILYQEWLAEEMSSRGYEVVCFFGIPYDKLEFPFKPYLKIWEKNKVKYIVLYNSPNFPHYLTPPAGQCHNSQIEKLMRLVIRKEKPGLIHFHELQMHTASVIDVAAESSIPSVKMIHNYYDICPERDLMFKGKEPCTDYENGERCKDCLNILVKRKTFSKMLADALYSIFVVPLPRRLYKPLSYIFHCIGKYKNTFLSPLDLLHKSEQLGLQKSPDISDKSHRRRRFSCKIKGTSSLKKETTGEVSAPVTGDFSGRRKYFIDRLNRLSAVQCSSARSAEIMTGYGVNKDKIRIIFPSSKPADGIRSKPLRGRGYPVVFGYVGGKSEAKGLNVLTEAFSLLEQTKAKLIIWTPEKDIIVPEGANIEVRKPYKTDEMEKVFSGLDVGVMPSIWEEAFGLIGVEWLKAKIPVIGSRIGGIPEWLKDGENGYLVKPNNAAELSEKMDIFVKNPENIGKMQEKMKPWKSFAEHADEMVLLYEELSAKRE
ncbi:MAG: hypothetical protein A2452_01425 [Candidatus Firestonebacteria bacterium RIFOXYC2_FULL_39_67]|nr:MAG: hypothetical protein A2536_03055 [Candidatus Firestonebacteria bacterium RIFOXYD2_FULL_39_29]OGF53612.1 MAG: hypothetical protein A2452_01425 [Candidatus Firestonebacteria bacterium RIFOXYC2_FULL_39_67]OGF54520.1 MAG: hypothetical protein A2497_05810 [Candidatus Firestonebacteria bacterium RifOxyC12_full_39_7]